MFKNMFYIFLEQEDICEDWFKRICYYFYNHNKNLYNKFEFLESYCIYTF